MAQDMLDQRLRHVIMSGTVAIYTAKASDDYGVTSVTDNVRQLTGYEPLEFTEDSSFWLEHVHPEDRPRVLDEMPCLFKQGSHTVEYRFAHKDGTYRWIRDEMKLVAGGSGNPAEVMGFWIDITEGVRAEETLERRAAQLALLRDMGGMFAAILDLEAVLDRAAHLVQESFGYHHVALFIANCERGELVMKAKAGDFAHLFPPDHRLKLGRGMVGWTARQGVTLLANDVALESRYVNAYPDVLPTRSELSVPIRVGEEVVGVLDVQSPQLHAFDDNDVLVMETLADQIAVAIENARLYEAVLRELDEREQAEEALREGEERYKRLLGSVTDYIYTVKVENGQPVATVHGPGCVAVTGYTSEEYEADPYLWYHMVYDEDRPAVVEQANRVLAGQTVPPLEHRIVHRDGSIRWVRNTAVPHYDDQQHLVAYDGLIADITERRQAQSQKEAALEALRESEAAVKSIFLAAPTGIGVVSNRILTQVNDRLCEMVGYSRDELVGQSARIVYPGDEEFEWVGREKYAQIRERGTGAVETHWRRKDGSIIDVWLSSTPLNPSDLAAGVTFTALDITERKQAEERLRRRNRELGLLNQIIATSASDLEPEALLETACRELARAFDVPRVAVALLNAEKTQAVVTAEYCAEGWPMTLHEAILVEGNQAFQHLLAHKVPLVVDDTQSDPRLAAIRELMRQRGTVSLLLLPLVAEGEVVGSLDLDAAEPRHFSSEEVNLAWSVADQTAGALARARLAQAHQRLIIAIEQAAEGVVITDTQGLVLYINPAFESITGRSRAETVGQTSLAFAGDNRPNAILYEQAWAALKAGKVWQGRFVRRTKAGAPAGVAATVTPVRGESGAIVSYVAVIRDITRELQLEEQYRQAQKMEVVGQLTAGIAHDFNNLLTAINGFAELMQLELPADDPLQETTDKILSSGRRAADLVRQLLAFSRKQIMEPQVLNLNKVVGDMDKMLRRIIGEHIDLRVCLASELWPVKVDPAQINQVIVNLAVNARDAMPDGGHLTIETANVVLDEDDVAHYLEGQPGQYVLLVISDDGIGMSDKVKAHLFEPFFTTKEVGQGTGLGLATVFGIVKQSDGHIRVYSEEGRGTTFKIYLPLAQEMADALPGGEETGALPRGTEMVLLVEDDLTVGELVHRLLTQHGYAVLMASSGAEALVLARQYGGEIQLLLTDVVMPGLSGAALAEQLAEIQPTLKVLFMSGYTNDAIVHHGVLEPGISFLQKPFGPADLLRKVRAVLDSRTI
jgi:two-component system cell cycle sensor histidine kinase/response regulator CckA